MTDETIRVRTENGQELEVVVSSTSADAIWIVLGEGIHNVKCKLSPARNGLAYVGTIMGREVVFERSVREVQADIDRVARAKPGRFRR